MGISTSRTHPVLVGEASLTATQAVLTEGYGSYGSGQAGRMTVVAPRGSARDLSPAPMLSPRRAADAKFVAALHPLIGAIPVETMRKANLSVDRDQDKQTPAQAADALAKAIGR